jgi:hypothetical protein
MQEVFQAGLGEVNEKGVVVDFIMRELLRLPANLIGVYMWSMRSGVGKQVAVSSMEGGGTAGVSLQCEGWGSSIMAGLPHLLFGIIIVSSEIITGVLGNNQNAFEYLGIGFVLQLLGLLIFSIYKSWRSWTASWIVYIFVIAVSLLSVAWNELRSSIIGNNWAYEIQILVIPLVLAYLFYKIACKDRLRGLLAAVPPITLIWLFFL